MFYRIMLKKQTFVDLFFSVFFPLAAEIAAELDRDEQESSGVMAAVKHQEREYLGMLEYNKVDESALIKNLIHGK